jgi:hypothetical protein
MKLMSYAYGRKKTPQVDANPMHDVVLREYEDAAEIERRERVVREFKSSAAPVQGAVDYGEMDWQLFTRAVESRERFTFYSGANIAKVVEKSRFADTHELETFRRMVRRYVADSKTE